MRLKLPFLRSAFLVLVALGAQPLAADAPAGKSGSSNAPDQTPEGLSKSDWQSIRAAHTAWQHGFTPIQGGWQARNPGQQWTTRFDDRGFLTIPREGDWTWGLELESYGRGGRQTPVINGTAVMKSAGQRLTYQWDGSLQEWWINDQRGLEHGYTLARRPAGTEGETLELLIATRGRLIPQVTADAQGVLFQDAKGATVINYTGLKVFDTDGKTLVSRFEAAGEERVKLIVDDKTARYPITIDPIAQQAYLKSGGDVKAQDGFGSSVAVSGNTVIVGAPYEDSSTTGVNGVPNETAGNSGAAFVFVFSGTTWSQQAYLKAGNAGSGDGFGGSVGIDGNTVVIGARSEDSSTTGINSASNNSASDSGAAYVFIRSGSTWSQQAYLKASNTGANDYFGTAVSVSGGTVMVGAIGEDSDTTGINSVPNESGDGSGAAYVFIRSGTTWSQQAYVKAGNTAWGANFGNSVGISGDSAVVGAREADTAYVFVRSGTTWSQQAKLNPSFIPPYYGASAFGCSVAINGNTVVVGAYFDPSSSTGGNSSPNENAFAAGAVYVFVRSGTAWSQQAYLKADNTGTRDYFGSSVGIDGDTVIIGAPNEDSGTTGINSVSNDSASDAGAAYVFVRSGTTWSQQAYVKAGNTGADDRFGTAVAINGATSIVGSPVEDGSTVEVNGPSDEAATSAGAAYAFVRSGTTWTQQAYLKSADPNIRAGDSFGSSVAVDADTVIVGASGEDSSSAGVNSTPNENASFAGAAYVFVRSGTTWTQQAYLKASNPGAGDIFGTSVAVNGDTAVVGACWEDSGTTGVGSVSNDSATDAGAAYVFVRSGTTWSQQAYLKADNTGAGDRFGISVGVSGDMVIVGAPSEDSGTTGVATTPDETATDSGAAYVFVRSGTTWEQQVYLKASNTGADDQFGTSVAVSGNSVVIGAPHEDSSPTRGGSSNENAANSGAAYVFSRTGRFWSQQAFLKSSRTDAGDQLGTAVAISGNTLVVGAPYEDSSTTEIDSIPDEAASDSGAAYVFFKDTTVWTQQSYLKAGNAGAGDQFGSAVAVSVDTVVAGAKFEDASTIGVNGATNDSAADAGAAYVFIRNGTAWSRQAYLKAGNAGAGDYFGTSVAVSGGTVAVGATGEDSSSTAINSTPDESASYAGAAYLFVGLGPVPPEIAISGNGSDIINGDITPSLVDGTDFGSVSPNGGMVARSFTISNSATMTLTLTGSAPNYVAVGGTGSSAFTVTIQPASASVGPNGGTQTFVITFDPSLTGTYDATVSIANNDSDENPFTFAISGVGRPVPEIALSGNGADIANGDNTPGTTDGTNFGSIAVNGGAAVRSFTLSNSGPGDLTLTGSAPNYVTLSGSNAFTVLTQPASATVAANGGTRTFVITFDPSASGIHNAIVNIANDDGDENPFTFAISGTGTLTPIETWRLQHFGTTANSGNAADTFDFDKDGLANLIEWGCNLNPTTSSVLPASLALNGGTLEYTYTRSVIAVNAGTTFAIEWSDTLVGNPFSNTGVTQAVLNDNGTTQLVKATLPTNNSAKRFVRLRVTAPP